MATEFKLSYTGSEVNQKLEKIDGLVNAEQRLTNEIEVERARINSFTALGDGSTTGDAELQDIRVGYDGETYANAGEAVRTQISDIHSFLNDNVLDIEPSETIVGKNLLNLDAPMPDPDDPYSGGFLRGKLFNDAGEISDNPAACITDYIPVQEGSYIIGTSSYGDAGRVGMNFRRVMGYDENKNLIGLLVSTKRIVTPTQLVGVAYVRMQVTTTYADAEGQIEYTAIDNGGTEYEPYTETVILGACTIKPECMPTEFAALPNRVDSLDGNFESAPDTVIVGKNLLNLNAPIPNPADIYSGGFLRGLLFKDDGTIEENAAACITDYIPVQEGSYILGSSSYGDAGRIGMNFRRVMGYDEDKNLIGLLVSTKRYASPEDLLGVAYVRMQVATTHADAEGQIEYADTETAVGTEYEPYTATVISGESMLKTNRLPAQFADLPSRVSVLENQTVGGATLAIDKARFDGRFNYIAYSDINGVGKDINSREHFSWAAKQDFTALKGDIEITSDGKLIMCHDAGFTIDENGKVALYDSTNATAIHDMTEAECLALQHARYGGSVIGFEEYIRICKKYGKIAYITVRNHYVDEYVPELLRVLRKYGMVKQCIISAYPYFAPLQAVREADPTIMLAYVLGHNAGITTADIDLAISMGNMLISGFNFSTANDDVDTQLAGSVAAIEYAHANDIRVYEAQVHTAEIADKLMEYGITGAQIRFTPSFE